MPQTTPPFLTIMKWLAVVAEPGSRIAGGRNLLKLTCDNGREQKHPTCGTPARKCAFVRLSSSICHRAYGGYRARRHRPIRWICAHSSASPVSDAHARVRPSPDGRDPASTSRVRRIARCSGSCVASSILLVALIGGVLLDVPLAALGIEVLASGLLLVGIDLRVGTRSFVAPLFRRHGRHLGHRSFFHPFE